MGLWNQLDRRCTKEIKYKGLCNDYQGRRCIEQMIRWTTTERTNFEIKFKIYSTRILYSKKGQIITIGIGLQEVEPKHNKGQDSTTLNWGSNQQTQGGEII